MERDEIAKRGSRLAAEYVDRFLAMIKPLLLDHMELGYRLGVSDGHIPNCLPDIVGTPDDDRAHGGGIPDQREIAKKWRSNEKRFPFRKAAREPEGE